MTTKNVKRDSPRQARRQRAFDRFRIDPAKHQADPAYMERKNRELAALKTALGAQAQATP